MSQIESHSCLEELCIAQTTDRNKKSAEEQKKMLKHETRLKQLMKGEAAKKMHKMIKSTKPSKFGKSVSQLEAPPLTTKKGSGLLTIPNQKWNMQP